MSNENKYAIIGMFAIVITFYALKESHTHWLPDLFGLALALTAQRPSYGVGAVILLALIRHSHLANGLADRVPIWLHPIVLPGAHSMSSVDADYRLVESAYKERISEPEPNLQYIEIPQPVAENTAEKITFAENRVLARLVAAGKVGKTDAIKIGAGVKSGTAYQTRTKQLQQQIEEVTLHYPELNNLKQRKPTRN